MTTQQLKDKYTELYDYMAMSNKTAYMKAFGHVMTEMFDWYATNKPEMAEEWVCRLDAIMWKNYLTPKEAETIVSKMEPAAPWSRDVWNKAMDSFGYDKEEKPYYNSCALWVTMNMIMSDHSQTLAKAMGVEPSDIELSVIHSLALDLLKDRDGTFSVRDYFSV